MSLFSNTEFTNLEELFVEQIKDLYDAENRLVDAIPDLVDAATAPELRAAFDSHLTETKGHVTRLEQVFEGLGIEPDRETCDGIKGLLKEGEEIIKAKGDPAVKDAGLIAAAQRVEHYEMAGYGTARTLANVLGRSDLAAILQSTLDEEGNADHHLTDIAETVCNPMANRA